MGEGHGVHLGWELLIFVAAIVSVASLLVEYTIHVSEETEHLLHTVDLAALALFATDIVWKYRVFRSNDMANTEFVKKNWLDILAIIPVFRIFRMGRFARLARISRIQKTSKAFKTAEKATSTLKKTKKGVSGYAHARHAKDAADHIR